MNATTATLPVENPTIVHLLPALKAQTGLTITTDQQGKDDAKAQLVQHGGVMVESRYFLGGVLITRAIGTNPNNGMPTFEWTCEGQTFSNDVDAIRRALSIISARS